MKLQFSMRRFSGSFLVHLLNVLLVSLLAMSLAYWTWQLWLLSSSPDDGLSETAAVKELMPAYQASTSDLKTRWFDATSDRPVVQVRGKIRLVGVFAAANGRPSHAIISANGAPAQTLTEGAQLASGEKIEKIHSDHVILYRDGVSERLNLDRKPVAQGLISPVQNPLAPTGRQ